MQTDQGGVSFDIAPLRLLDKACFVQTLRLFTPATNMTPPVRTWFPYDVRSNQPNRRTPGSRGMNTSSGS